MARADPLLLRLVVTLLSRRLSLLDDDEEELELDDELEELLDRVPDDELLSEELLFQNSINFGLFNEFSFLQLLPSTAARY